MDEAFDSLEEGKKWLIGELREYFEGQNIEFTEGESPPRYLHEIKCDRCGKLADFDGGGGNCPECGDDLCIQCAESWTELAGDDETSHCVCKRCRNKYAADDTPCDRCGKHGGVGNGGAVCQNCEDVLCGTCGWWSDEDYSPLCIRCRDKRTGDDLIAINETSRNSNMYTITVKFNWEKGVEEKSFTLDSGDKRFGKVIASISSDKWYAVNYLSGTASTQHFGSLQEAKDWVIDEIRDYYEWHGISIVEGAKSSLELPAIMAFTEAREKMKQGETILRLSEPQLMYKIDETNVCVVNCGESAKFHLADFDATDWITHKQYQQLRN
jgi:hypothetical protein